MAAMVAGEMEVHDTLAAVIPGGGKSLLPVIAAAVRLADEACCLQNGDITHTVGISACRQHALQAVPVALRSMPRAGIHEPQFLDSVAHASEVTACAGDHDVGDPVVSASTVGNQVVELHPQRLERRMLWSPRHLSRVHAVEGGPHRRADNGDAAEYTVPSVSRDDCGSLHVGGHPDRHAVHLR